jgi:N6-adenosine-specific RNA methylase IME4
VVEQMRDAPPLPNGKYRIFYADPPWSYGNSGVIGPTDNYGHVHRHYPSMSIAELCAMGPAVRDMAEDNAVLFMWVTSPLLEECFDVIRAWGFKYKTSFVWDKVRHNFGHYNSVRHELLLVCTRGSCTPDNPRLYDSVQTIERSDTHSEKPGEFRDMIEELYEYGGRIELFARVNTDGWEAWGNE